MLFYWYLCGFFVAVSPARIVIDNCTSYETIRISYTLFENLHFFDDSEGGAICVTGSGKPMLYSDTNQFFHCSVGGNECDGGAIYMKTNGSFLLFRNCAYDCCAYWGSFATFITDEGGGSINESAYSLCADKNRAFISSMSLNHGCFICHNCNSSLNYANKTGAGFGSRRTKNSTSIYCTFSNNEGDCIVFFNGDRWFWEYCNIVNNTVRSNIIRQAYINLGFSLHKCSFVGNSCPPGNEFESSAVIDIAECKLDWDSAAYFTVSAHRHLNTGLCIAEIPYETKVFTQKWEHRQNRRIVVGLDILIYSISLILS